MSTTFSHTKFYLLLCLFAATWIAPRGAVAQETAAVQSRRADGRRNRPRNMVNNAEGGIVDSGNQVLYHGGPVLLGTIDIYYIWYGNWDGGSMAILNNFASSIGGSPYFNIDTGYFNGMGTTVSNSVVLAGSTQDNYSRGSNLSSNDIPLIVTHALSNHELPLDSNGVYFVLTSGDVNVEEFPGSLCGYHSQTTYNNTSIQYAFIGNPGPQGFTGCIPSPNESSSPNGNIGADAMASTIAHELQESTTDPALNAWYDASGNEIADKCAWTFGNTYNALNGSEANMQLGGLNYLIQQVWVNAGGGYCALSASYGANFALSPTVDSQTVIAGNTTGNYSLSIIPVMGFSGSVSFSATGMPPGASLAGTIPSSTSGATFSIATASNLPAGTYTFTINGTSGSLVRPASETLVVSGQTQQQSPVNLTIGTISPEPSHVAQPYTVNFSVTAGTGTPTGNVTVSDGSESCTVPVATGNCTLVAGTAGTKTITVAYSGGGQFPSANKTTTHTVEYGGSLSDLVSGAGWESIVTLVNLGSTSSSISLNLFGDSGSALALPFTYPQGTGGPFNGASVSQIMAPNSTLLLDTNAAGQGLSEGWADLLAAGDVNAYGVFRYNPNGQEAVVPMETRTGPLVLLFDNTTLVNPLSTDVALANLGAQSVSVPFLIRDDTGAQITSGMIPLAPHAHTTFVLASQYPGTAGKRGMVQFGAPPNGQISVLGIRANGNSFTTIPAIQSGPLGGSMPYIASGGGWRSIFYVANMNSTASNITLSFFDGNGNPLSLPLTFLQTGVAVTAATITHTVAPGALLVIEAQGLGPQVALGAARLTSDQGTSGFALFRYDPDGQEATVPLETRNAGAYVLAFDNTAPLATGVSVANLSNQPASVGMILRDDTGALLQAISLQVPANGQSAFVLGENYPLTAGKRGTVEFDSTVVQISVLGVRANGNAFTSIPVLTR